MENQKTENTLYELGDETLNRVSGGREENDPKRCLRCGNSNQPLFHGYCPRCRAALGI